MREGPEIFFTKLLKEKGTSVSVLENVDKATMANSSSLKTFDEIKVYTKDQYDKDSDVNK